MKAIRILSNISPVLLAIFTVTTLYYANSERLNPGQIMIPMMFAASIGLLFVLLFWLNGFSKSSGGFAGCVFCAVFLLWHTIPLVLSIIALVATVGINFKGKIKYQYTGFAAVVMIIAILITGIGGIMNYSGGTNAVIGNYTYTPGQPNIYFIVPDRMPSPDAMIESGINPALLVESLRDSGFYVPMDNITHDTYTANYTGEVHTTRTMRFFASVLNGGEPVYLDIDYKDCRNMINQSSVFDSLHDSGYQITNIASWFSETNQLPKADYNPYYSDVSFIERCFRDELSKAYFERTILNGLNFRVLESDNSIKSVELGRHLWQYENIIDIAQSGKTSQFVMAHIMLPHEPFIYTDATEKSQQYHDQIVYAMSYINSLADEIRANDPTAIIVIQSDEGMAYRSPKELNFALSAVQWFGVFTAWYIPGYEGDYNINHNQVLTKVLPLVYNAST